MLRAHRVRDEVGSRAHGAVADPGRSGAQCGLFGDPKLAVGARSNFFGILPGCYPTNWTFPLLQRQETQLTLYTAYD